MAMDTGKYACNAMPTTMERKTPEAERIMIYLDELVKQSDELAEYFSARLSSLIPPVPPSVGVGPSQPEPPMAPLFGEYRGRITQVRESMLRVRNMIERCEV